MYKFKVSVVMAVYNVEPFIREAIDSVIAQDIGFEKIQLILVDDGSPDGSGAICDEYAAKYPENIVVIHKENGGVSSARNAGLDRVEGEFVNFMDPDDKLEINACSAASQFLEKYEDEIDVVTIPMKYFDGKTGDFTLNYIFEEGTRIIDLEENWDCIQSSVSSAFIKNTCFHQLRFDARLTSAEDTKLLNLILLEKRALGVISDTAYWYRVRSSGMPSAMQNKKQTKGWYIDFMKYYQREMVTYCLNRFQQIPRYIQYMLMVGLRGKINQKTMPSNVLAENELQEYFCLIHEMLQHIEDEVIEAQRDFNRPKKLFTYRLKYGDYLIRLQDQNDIGIRAQNELHRWMKKVPLKLEFYENRGDSCILEGTLKITCGLFETCQILVKVGDTTAEADVYGSKKQAICLDQRIEYVLTFKIVVPLEAGKKNKLEFYCETEGYRIPLRNIKYGSFFPISEKYKHIFFASQNWILTQHKGTLQLHPRWRGSFLRHELLLCRELWATKNKDARKSVISRMLLHVLKPFKRKPLWLVSDRASKAGDNGEAFFRYVRENHPEIDVRFVINGDCPDYDAVKKIGPVIKKDSYYHKFIHLLSDCIISSHADNDMFNPFYREAEPYRNLVSDIDVVFLQHGVIVTDHSGWLARFKKNLKGFVTTAAIEYESILRNTYGYTEKETWLTGMPRFDRLYQDSDRWVTIMPTWRRTLMGTLDYHTGIWTLNNDSENSKYILFYNRLLNDKRLHEASCRYGYRLKFLPHPNLQQHLSVFKENEHVDILTRQIEYREIYAKSDLVITDYSSSVFDFVYLRKPIVYAQFDVETFFSGGHTCKKDYFDYERDGFGEVEYDLDSTVDRIIEYMENGCQLKEKYRQRIENFFAFNDQNNCKRVFEKIMELYNQ